MKYLWVVFSLFLSCNSESEAEREEAAISKALPKRLQANGSIQLSPEDIKALSLLVEPASEGELAEVIPRYGIVKVRPGEEAQLMSPVSGKLQKPPTVALGAFVTEGTPLLEVTPVVGAAESITFSAQRADIEGQIKAAEIELANQKIDAERQRELAKSGLVSAKEVSTAETLVATTSARLDALRRARVVQSGGTGAAITLKAPVSGTIVSLDTSVGEVVSPGLALIRIVTPGPRWIDVSVPPGEPSGEGYEVFAGESWISARLLYRGVVIDADGTRHDRLEIPVESSASLLPGQVAKVRVAGKSAKGILVPESALVSYQGGYLVYVETSPNLFVSRDVSVAAWFGGKARLSSGLSSGEKLVTRGAMSLRGESLRSELRHQE